MAIRTDEAQADMISKVYMWHQVVNSPFDGEINLNGVRTESSKPVSYAFRPTEIRRYHALKNSPLIGKVHRA
jgi:hypothetical protein